MCAAALTYALIHGGDSGWHAPATVAAFALAAAALAAFIAVERRRLHPLLDLALFRRPSFSTLMAAGVLLTGCAFAPTVYTQLWLQSVLDLPAITAGLVLLPMAGVAFVVSAAAGRFMHGMAPRFPLGVGLLLIGAGALLRVTLTAQSGWTVLIPGPGCHRRRCRARLTGARLRRARRRAPAAIRHGQRRRQHLPPGRLRPRHRGVRLGLRRPSRADHRPQRPVPRPAAVTAQASQGGADALIAASPHPAAVGHVIGAAYAAGQNAIYLGAGAAALLGGLLVLVLIRPDRPDTAAPRPARPSPATPASERRADRTGRAPARSRSAQWSAAASAAFRTRIADVARQGGAGHPAAAGMGWPAGAQGHGGSGISRRRTGAMSDWNSSRAWRCWAALSQPASACRCITVWPNCSW